MASPALVQSKQGDGSGSTSLALTLSSATTAGNCLVVAFSLQTSGAANPSVSGVTLGGSAGNFGSLISAGISTSEAVIGIWADPSCAGGQTAVSVNITGGSGTPFIFASAMEFSGLATTLAALLDKSSTAVQGTSSSSWSSGSTAVISNADEALVGMIASDTVTITGPSSPWVNGAQLTNGGIFMSGYQVTSSAAAESYAGTFSAAKPYVGGIVTLNPAGASPSSPSGLLEAIAF